MSGKFSCGSHLLPINSVYSAQKHANRRSKIPPPPPLNGRILQTWLIALCSVSSHEVQGVWSFFNITWSYVSMMVTRYIMCISWKRAICWRQIIIYVIYFVVVMCTIPCYIGRQYNGMFHCEIYKFRLVHIVHPMFSHIESSTSYTKLYILTGKAFKYRLTIITARPKISSRLRIHIYASVNSKIIRSDNDLSPVRHQTFISTNAG